VAPGRLEVFRVERPQERVHFDVLVKTLHQAVEVRLAADAIIERGALGFEVNEES
jgi:hypothetical protein